MKLLFDENLSAKLVVQLADLFPASIHVRDIGLAKATDPIVWQYAIENGPTIVSKDEDFHHLSFLRGAPPKVIGILRATARPGSLPDFCENGARRSKCSGRMKPLRSSRCHEQRNQPIEARSATSGFGSVRVDSRLN